MPALSDRLLLCSWNIHLGRRLDVILSSVRTCEYFRGLDLLLLQEASMRDRQTDAEALARALGPTYRSHQRNVDRLHGRVRGLGLVWNSATFELLAANMLELPHVRHARVQRRHRYWLNPLRLRPRSALIVEGLTRGKRARLYVIHLSPVGFAFQTEQLAAVLRHAAHRGPVDLLVIAGDFNSLRLNRRKWATWFAARESEGFVNATEAVDWTFRSPALPMRQKLDNALVKAKQALVCASHCPDLQGSDHLPLFVEIASAGSEGTECISPPSS
jgi:endonuclease/exonuclease/phosphatase family metal-dependent hydrolase